MSETGSMKLLVVGVGHRYRGDDGAGPLVCDLLKERLGRDGDPSWGTLEVIDADIMPENFTKPIRNSAADVVLFIDAVDTGREPGAILRIDKDAVGVTMPSTHSMSISFIMDRIVEHKDRVELIGIQAQNLGLFSDLTEAVRESCSELAGILFDGGWEGIPYLALDNDR